MIKKNLKKKLPAAVLSAALLTSAAVVAGEVTIDGVHYTCENTCMVTFTPDGATVRDSEGGWWGYAFV